MSFYNDYIIPYASMYFLCLCRYFGNAKDFFLNIYATNEIVQLVTDKTYLTTMNMYCFLIGQKREPSVEPWISTVWLETHPDRLTNTFQLSENYTHNFANIITADLFGESDKAQYANQYFSKVSADFKEENLNPLVIFKTRKSQEESQIYIVRRGGLTYDNLSFEKSRAKFLSIEYTHPDLSESIELSLDRSWMIDGNELFTPTFILRMLCYQPVMFFFDQEYTVKIMDDNCKILTITMNEYIVLTKEGYEIKSTDESAVLVEPTDE